MKPVEIEREGSIAIIIIDNPPVSAGSIEVHGGLLDAIRNIAADEAIEAAVVIGPGTPFIAGSAIKEFVICVGVQARESLAW